MATCIGITCDFASFENKLSAAYTQAVAASGAVPLLIPLTASSKHWRTYLALLDGLILSGGGDPDAFHYGQEALPGQGWVQPKRDTMEIFLARCALTEGVPILGICRGAQLLNISAGGTLHQDLRGIATLQHSQRAPRSYPIHSVRIAQPSLLYRLIRREKIRVNSFHHQAVHLPGNGLSVSAEAADGVVEAVEAVDHPFALGVQWHPEWLIGRQDEAVKIFTALKEAAEKRRKMAVRQRKFKALPS